jgi:hypothetical protein
MWYFGEPETAFNCGIHCPFFATRGQSSGNACAPLQATMNRALFCYFFR